MVFSNIKRLQTGLLLVLSVLSSYFLYLDNFFLILIFLLINYDFFKLRLIKINYLLFSIITSLLFLIFIPYEFFNNLYILEIFLVVIIFFNTKYKKELFILSTYIFCFILLYILNINRDIFYLIIFISFFNDTIAFIFGKNIGGPLIIPNISPNKTWSGTTISFFITTGSLVYLNYNILLSVFISIFLFLGDIFFSYIKRFLNIKDFSLLLGSHGGILDRLDSMFFIAIIFQIYLVVFI